VTVDGTLPVPGTPVLRGATEVGTMRSGLGQSGLAVLRIDALRDVLSCGDATLTVRVPAWISLPESVA
jgi:hypothetical protein